MMRRLLISIIILITYLAAQETTAAKFRLPNFTSTDLTNGSSTGGYFPVGGVSAIAVKGDTVFVAFASSENDFPIGKGVVYTANSATENPVWIYYDQPVDLADAETFPWGGIGFVQGLPITVPQYNVTYDASIGNGYVWITSWAGGLRRYKISDGSWERVPVPEDDQLTLITLAATTTIKHFQCYLIMIQFG